MSAAGEVLFRLDRFSVRFPSAAPVVEDLTLEVRRGECLGIVGQSGAGKSLALLAALGLAPARAQISGQVWLCGEALHSVPPRQLGRLRARTVGMIFQDPMSSLTPHLRIGTQLTEVLKAYGMRGGRARRARALALLEQVHLPEPALQLQQFPDALSGGMLQRVMIAIALAGEPRLLIADEPTTALDVTTQAQILKLLLQLKTERGLALALVSHDLGVIAGLADRIAVLRAGRLIECASVHTLLGAPREPYTRTLVAVARALENPAEPASGPPAARQALVAVAAQRVRVEFALAHRRTPRRALDAVTLHVVAGESFGILGESGSGKSTLTQVLLGLLRPQSGQAILLGCDLQLTRGRALRNLRGQAQLVFQDPFGSLDPAMRVRQILAEPLRIHTELAPAAQAARILRALEEVELSADFLERFPSQLSGGQCQRVGIARALVLEPQVLVCDEPLSALDVSVQARILALLQAIRARRSLTLILVSHHLGVVRALCTRALVLYRGRMMECAPVAQLHAAPCHPYTRSLLAATVRADPQQQRDRLRALPVLRDVPAGAAVGCVFVHACPHAIARCTLEEPAWEETGTSQVACHRWREWHMLGGVPQVPQRRSATVHPGSAT